MRSDGRVVKRRCMNEWMAITLYATIAAAVTRQFSKGTVFSVPKLALWHDMLDVLRKRDENRGK